MNSVLARRLKMARCGADLSLHELADAVSLRLGRRISHELIRRIEIGERDVEFGIIQAVADITGEPISWLTDGAITIPGYLSHPDLIQLFPSEPTGYHNQLELELLTAV